jgi:hypothetical protein
MKRHAGLTAAHVGDIVKLVEKITKQLIAWLPDAHVRSDRQNHRCRDVGRPRNRRHWVRMGLRKLLYRPHAFVPVIAAGPSKTPWDVGDIVKLIEDYEASGQAAA